MGTQALLSSAVIASVLHDASIKVGKAVEAWIAKDALRRAAPEAHTAASVAYRLKKV